MENITFSEGGLYIRMYGGSRAPSLLPKYSTNYIVHKEVVRHLYIDGIGNFLFDQKKVVYPPLPFYIGSYKFSKVKSASEFGKELKYFHFGEKSFHINDLENKIADYHAIVGVHFKYTEYWDKDKEIFRNSRKMTALIRRFKKMIKTTSGK